MNKTLGEFLNDLAVSANIPSDDATLKKVLSNAAIAAYEIPDDFATKIQSAHLTVESAKANKTLSDHFLELNFNRVDKTLFEGLKEVGVDDDAINELKSIKKMKERLPASLKKLSELKTQAASAGAAGATGKQKELETQIATLIQKSIDQNAQFAAEKQALLSGFDNERKDGVLNNMLLGYEYAGEQPKDVQAQLVKILLDKKLKESNYKTEYKDGNLELVTNEGTPVFDTKNTKISLKALTDTLVAENKLIKVSGAGNGSGNNGAAGVVVPFGGKAGDKVTPFDTHLKEQLASLGIQQ